MTGRLADIVDEAGERSSAELGEHAVFQHLDVTDEESWALAVGRAAALGRWGIRVNAVLPGGIHMFRGTFPGAACDKIAKLCTVGLAAARVSGLGSWGRRGPWSGSAW